MGHIVVLDRNMINMIAAGEVIERPASVVKELMENSIDAGASKIIVTIEEGGRKLISVTDDGCGMDAADLEMAFEPHATSKIRTNADLLAISTLGFRGEALASIAAVAQVRAASRTKDALSGNCMQIDCGKKSPLSPCSADYGTTIEVRDLFYKLPARRKFLRTPATETGHISEQFTRIALANPGLDMTLINNGRETYRLLGNQELRGRIGGLFSKDIAENLIETQAQEKTLRIRALLGKPGISRTNNNFQYVFINGRFIRDKFISHAIKEAYRGHLEPNRFPVVFLYLEMPPDELDVNVHPTKIEVRFYNANLVHSQILACMRQTLLSADFPTEVKLAPFAQPSSQSINDAMAEFFKRHRPPHTQPSLDFGRSRSSARAEHRRDVTTRPDLSAPTSAAAFIQIHDTFIVAQTPEGFVVIDQHALHERIMYEDLRHRMQQSKLESQKLLIPESFELTNTQNDVLTNSAPLIERLGVELVPFGPRTMAVQAFPTLLAKASPVEFVRDLADLLIEKGSTLNEESLLDEVLHMAACKAAIKAGQKLTPREIEQLLADRETVDFAGHCPHGRPTTISFTLTQLEKQFKRT
jgi:DNA mismatch repair protein MutL